ncbi:MAG: hypothetical protein O2799_04705, partial [Planctomycetota bacterium]|nr:hypothetical protein [Planctomycetota bacterium]
MRLPVALLALLAPLMGPVEAQSAGPDLPGLPYQALAGQNLLMDLWLGEGPGPHPCVVYLHGGGWVSGNRSLDRSFVAGLVNSGITVA